MWIHFKSGKYQILWGANCGNRWAKERPKFVNLLNKLTEWLANVICVILEEGEVTKIVSQKTSDSYFDGGRKICH